MTKIIMWTVAGIAWSIYQEIALLRFREHAHWEYRAWLNIAANGGFNWLNGEG